ncbi:MAG: SDR family NAD(P)-dependent oxidoreductase [Undibacterium sp.]|uniref:SDR family NAD(P)-dependent oxidoreductase n=1 Tax=Undibacterium sp. TaxID=1914977 RepID=UPI00271E19EC|nr:SDR family NAD(P)-dependent oxidoreductase [Undibacterium sp.]MDO8651801.1 SDR family NAD(P)-dependent oxidoreductase [Undibacterium sp.]
MGKTILITGAGSGFGKLAAFALAKRGHSVIAATYDQAQADALAHEVTAAGVVLKIIRLDITSEEDRHQVTGSAIDVLINNAGVGESGPLAEVPLDRIRRTFETNVIGSLGMVQLAVPELIKRGGGTIMFVTSLAGRMPIPFLAPYGMSKYALEVAGADLAVELKPFNIHVTMIEPGAFATGFNEAQIATKYSWLGPDSIYRDKKKFIEKNEQTVLGMQSGKIEQVIEALVAAVEAKKPKLRYAVPKWQGAGIQLLRAFGM